MAIGASAIYSLHQCVRCRLSILPALSASAVSSENVSLVLLLATALTLLLSARALVPACDEDSPKVEDSPLSLVAAISGPLSSMRTSLRAMVTSVTSESDWRSCPRAGLLARRRTEGRVLGSWFTVLRPPPWAPASLRPWRQRPLTKRPRVCRWIVVWKRSHILARLGQLVK